MLLGPLAFPGEFFSQASSSPLPGEGLQSKIPVSMPSPKKGTRIVSELPILLVREGSTLWNCTAALFPIFRGLARASRRVHDSETPAYGARKTVASQNFSDACRGT